MAGLLGPQAEVMPLCAGCSHFVSACLCTCCPLVLLLAMAAVVNISVNLCAASHFHVAPYLLAYTDTPTWHAHSKTRQCCWRTSSSRMAILMLCHP